MIKPQKIKLLSDDDREKYLNNLDKLSNEWREWNDLPAPLPYYVLGATSHFDAKKSISLYHKIKNYYNPLLYNNFSALYETLVEAISKELGEVRLEETLALPGFHIMGSGTGSGTVKLNFPDTYGNDRHKDYIYTFHLPELSKIYSNINTDETVSFALPLKLPRAGSGLVIWPENGEGAGYGDFYSNFQGGSPDFIAYEEGSLSLFPGDLYHQVAPIKECFMDDRRVVLLGHMILCDNIWRVYF